MDEDSMEEMDDTDHIMRNKHLSSRLRRVEKERNDALREWERLRARDMA